MASMNKLNPYSAAVKKYISNQKKEKKWGRQRLIDTPENMLKEWFKYLDSIFIHTTDENGNDIFAPSRPLTLSGFYLSLGLNPDSMSEYANYEDFIETYKFIKKTIEDWNVQQFYTNPKSTNGIKFVLANNYGWSEKTTVESTNTNIQKTLSVEIVDKEITKGEN